MASSSSPTSFFETLTWDDLNAVFGTSTVQRGRSYQRSRAVSKLGLTSDARLVAWVRGTERYATVVATKEGALEGMCSCPVGVNCKHAVAVVLEYLEHLKKNKPVPHVNSNDGRLDLAQADLLDDEDFNAAGDEWEDDPDEDEEDWDDDEDDDEYGEDDDAEDRARAPSRGRSPATTTDAPRAAKRGPASDSLRDFLHKQSSEALASYLLDLAKAIPEVRDALEDRRRAAEGSDKELIAATRKALDAASAEPGWTSHWSDEGYVPDYSRVQSLLQVMLERGAADTVVKLGEELLQVGSEQVSMSQDEGETAGEVMNCLAVVFQALPQTTKTPAEQILWAIDVQLQDDYDLCQDLDAFWRREFPREVWSEVADVLSKRLKPPKRKKADDAFTERYHRERLGGYLMMVLENAGREDEIIPLCEQEAPLTGSYERLVHRLLAAERVEEAEAWIRRGVEATREQYPGIASQLREMLRELRMSQGNWKAVAANRAQSFFQSPSVLGFGQLMEAAEKAECRPAVEQAARQFLETGSPPQPRARKSKNQTLPAWPLPEPEVPAEDPPRYGHRQQPPYYNVLIDLALKENDPRAALRWYDEAKAKKGQQHTGHALMSTSIQPPESNAMNWLLMAGGGIFVLYSAYVIYRGRHRLSP